MQMETTPDYKALLGKKILKLRPLGYDTEIQIGDPVMIFEGMVQTSEYRLSNIQALRELGYSELQWRIAPVNRQTLIKMYRDGIHKLVGVGIVFDQPNEYKDEYSVMVQDDVLEVFKQDIPF